MRKRILTVLALAVSLLMVAGVAVAQEADTEANGTVLHGKGTLVAKGNGTAILDMGGTLRMRVRGDVTITDLAGNATIVVNDGPDAPLSDRAHDGGTTVVLENFSGSIAVRGSHFRVRAHGAMEFAARGKGTAFLAGHGWWKTRNNRGTWSNLRVAFES